MKNLLKIGIAAAFGVAALAGATNGVRLNSELSYEQSVVEQKRARGWFDPLPNLLGLGETTFSASKLLLYEYTFTPFTSQYYVIEAASTDRTFMCVKNDVTEIYDGDDAGPALGDENAKILFYGVAFQNYRVIVARDGSLNPSFSANITLKVRKAKSVALLNDPTTDQSDIQGWNSIYVNMEKYEHTTYDKLTPDESIPLMNNELFYLESQAEVLNGGICYDKIRTRLLGECIELSDLPDMRNTRLALWNVDCSGVYGGFAHYSCMHGAKCAIGFTDLDTNYEYGSATNFCKALITELCNYPNKTIQQAVNSIMECYSNLSDNIQIYGNRNIKLFDSTESNHAFDLTKTFLSPLPTIGEFQK